MPQSLRLLMAQINPTVGAINANAEKIIGIIKAHQHDHDIIVFPELALTGYPPEDLLFRPEFYLAIHEAMQAIEAITHHCHVIVGHPYQEGAHCYNAASVLNQRHREVLYYKQHLPNYGVFDEKRYFTPGIKPAPVFNVKHQKIGLCICEDSWQSGPVQQLLNAKASLMISINASPFDQCKQAYREALLQTHAKQGLAIIYVNQVGGQDELVFDGQSMAFDPDGQLCARAPAFVETLQTVTVHKKQVQGHITPLLSREALIYNALQCGLRDYVTKNGFKGVLLGLSGGIDSALTLAIASDALGPERVQAVFMPSRYTAAMSMEDAIQQATLMHVAHTTLSIEPGFEALLTTLAPAFKDEPADITEENLQARIRGVLLMALSNKTGKMLLTTSNKSETAVGYSTLYGDMAGGFAVLKDVLKTTVYALAYYRNTIAPVIPERVLTRAPTAELAPNQTDQDQLPDYAVLDAIITHYMENNLSANEIIQQGYPESDVRRVIQWIKRNEYKRRQAAPGVKITTCAFGRDWRYPITAGF